MDKYESVIMMKLKLDQLTDSYLAALRSYLKADSRSGLETARELGARAVAMGLETLDLAMVHKIALATCLSPDKHEALRDDLTMRASVFFMEAITPIEETHRAAQETKVELHDLRETLGQRTHELEDSLRKLKELIAERHAAEMALKLSERESILLLKEARQLEEQLQDLARAILSANEVERKKMSCQLQDEIAQTLLGIHLRLLTLKKGIAASNEILKQDISVIERLVKQSIELTQRLSQEFRLEHEPQAG